MMRTAALGVETTAPATLTLAVPLPGGTSGVFLHG